MSSEAAKGHVIPVPSKSRLGT